MANVWWSQGERHAYTRVIVSHAILCWSFRSPSGADGETLVVNGSTGINHVDVLFARHASYACALSSSACMLRFLFSMGTTIVTLLFLLYNRMNWNENTLWKSFFFCIMRDCAYYSLLYLFPIIHHTWNLVFSDSVIKKEKVIIYSSFNYGGDKIDLAAFHYVFTGKTIEILSTKNFWKTVHRSYTFQFLFI